MPLGIRLRKGFVKQVERQLVLAGRQLYLIEMKRQPVLALLYVYDFPGAQANQVVVVGIVILDIDKRNPGKDLF